MKKQRKGTIHRKTNETDIQLSINLDGESIGEIHSGSAFLDHMLNLFQTHSGIGFTLNCQGDVDIDMHHSSEDIAICFGTALEQALGDKEGLERYGFYYVPMDEALARCVLDLSGRIAYEFHGDLPVTQIGNFETEMVDHFFKTFAQCAKINLHLDLIRGSNAHHCIEGLFKAFARALSMAIRPSNTTQGIPSTKGVLT